MDIRTMLARGFRVPPKPEGRIRFTSIDPGIRDPGFVVVDVWWTAEDCTPAAHAKCRHTKTRFLCRCMPQFTLHVALGEEVVGGEVNLKKAAVPEYLVPLMEYFAEFQEVLFSPDTDFVLVEQQDTNPHRNRFQSTNTRLLPTNASIGCFVHALLAPKMYSQASPSTQVTFVKPTWKTETAELPKSCTRIQRKKAAMEIVKKLMEVREQQALWTIIRKHRAKWDICDALCQALRYFVHSFPAATWLQKFPPPPPPPPSLPPPSPSLPQAVHDNPKLRKASWAPRATRLALRRETLDTLPHVLRVAYGNLKDVQ